MSRRIVQELTEQQSLILRQAAGRVMDAQSVVDHEDSIYKALLGMIYPGGGSEFDPSHGLGVFYVEEEDEGGLPVKDFLRLVGDEEFETNHEGDPHNARVEGADIPLGPGDEG